MSSLEARFLKILSELNVSYLKIAGILSQPFCLVSRRALDDEQWYLKEKGFSFPTVVLPAGPSSYILVSRCLHISCGQLKCKTEE